MITRSFPRLAALALVPLASCTTLPGCKSTYEVDVRNLADQPVSVRVQRTLAGSTVTLKDSRIAPGDRAILGPVEVDYGTHVWVNADFEGNIGYPGMLDLSQGLTVVNIRRPDEGAKGRIRLEEVRR